MHFVKISNCGSHVICGYHSALSGSFDDAYKPTVVDWGAVNNEVAVHERNLVGVLCLIVVHSAENPLKTQGK